MKKTIKFISFDGQDSVGKSTQLMLLQKLLQDNGVEIHNTRLIGGDKTDDFQMALRTVLLHEKFPSDSVELEEKLFAMADLEGYKAAEKFLEENANGIVLKDRNLASHLCYGLAKGLTVDQVAQIHGKLIHKERILNQDYGTLNLIFVADSVTWPLERLKKRAETTGEPIVERLENIENQEKVMSLFENIHNYSIFEGLNFELIKLSEEDTLQQVQTKVNEVLSKYNILGLNSLDKVSNS